MIFIHYHPPYSGFVDDLGFISSFFEALGLRATSRPQGCSSFETPEPRTSLSA